MRARAAIPSHTHARSHARTHTRTHLRHRRLRRAHSRGDVEACYQLALLLLDTARVRPATSTQAPVDHDADTPSAFSAADPAAASAAQARHLSAQLARIARATGELPPVHGAGGGRRAAEEEAAEVVEAVAEAKQLLARAVSQGHAQAMFVLGESAAARCVVVQRCAAHACVCVQAGCTSTARRRCRATW